MKVAKELLLPALTRAAVIADAKGNLPVCRCVRLEAKNGELVVAAAGDSERCEEAMPCDGELPSVLVSARKLFSLVSFGTEEQTFKLDKNKLAYDIGATGTLPTLKDELPGEPEGLKPIAVNPADLMAGIKAVEFAISNKEQERPELCLVHVGLSAKSLFCCASIGNTLAFNTKAAICGEFEFDVRRDFVKAFVEALAFDNAQLLASPAWLAIQGSSASYYCRRTEVKFPPTGHLTGQKRELIGVIAPDEWLHCFKLFQAIRGQQEQDVARVEVELVAKGAKLSPVWEECSQVLVGKFKPMKLRLNSNTFVRCLQAFSGQPEVRLLSVNGAVGLECGELFTITTQLS